MHRIDLNLFDRVKQIFPSDRHELRRTSINYQFIKREYLDWKSELDLPKKYSSQEMDLYYLAVNTALQHFESSLDFSQGLEYLLEEKRANIIPAICMLVRQTLESAFTASWLVSDTDTRRTAMRGYQITIRDLHNQYGVAKKLQEQFKLEHRLRFIDPEHLDKQRLELLLIGNQLDYSSKEVKEIFSPLITRLFKRVSIGGEVHNLSWAYQLLSAIGHGTWMGFYPSDKEFTQLLNIKDASLRVTLNQLKAKSVILMTYPQR
jgi:hypothetical protein